MHASHQYASNLVTQLHHQLLPQHGVKVISGWEHLAYYMFAGRLFSFKMALTTYLLLGSSKINQLLI